MNHPKRLLLGILAMTTLYQASAFASLMSAPTTDLRCESGDFVFYISKPDQDHETFKFGIARPGSASKALDLEFSQGEATLTFKDTLTQGQKFYMTLEKQRSDRGWMEYSGNISAKTELGSQTRTGANGAVECVSVVLLPS